MKNYKIGGIEVVTQVLANKFYNEGHKIFITTFEEPPNFMLCQLQKGIVVIRMGKPIFSRLNIRKLHNILLRYQIDVVINQWGLPFYPTLLSRAAIKGTKSKYISVYHSCPDANARIIDIQIALKKTSNSVKQFYMYGLKWIFKLITAKSMRFVYDNSDLYIVLSNSYKSIFNDFTGLKITGKLIAQTNPLTIDALDFKYDRYCKRPEIIFVGRIDNNKSVNRVIEIWALLENRFCDWSLTIIGDGPEKNAVILLAQEKGLKNISFEGFKDPINYYKRASILMLTSEYEGFPLVIAECMSFGVVPVVYGSFPSIYDIIDSDENGIVLKPCIYGFDKDLMAEELSLIIADPNKLNRMAESAIQTSMFFSLDKVYSAWMEIFKKII